MIALVSPQFRLTFDPHFETVKGVKTRSKWQNKAGFIGQKQPTTTAKPRTPTAGMRKTPSSRVEGTAGTPEGGKLSSSRKRKLQEMAMNIGVAGIPGTQEETSVPAAANVEGDGSSTPQDDHGEATEVTGQEGYTT